MRRPQTVFVLSPAHLGGKRAGFLRRNDAAFDLAARLQRDEPVPLGDVYAFVSGLYFRGKMAYARAFASKVSGRAAVFTITPDRGLVHVDEPVTLDDLAKMGEVDIDMTNPQYHTPLRRDITVMRDRLPLNGRVVLLGSIATAKYVDLLVEILGEQLVFPTDFVGRGDLSRGGLCLRAADSKTELAYAPVIGATRKGSRPPKLEPIKRLPKTRHPNKARDPHK